MLDKGDISPPQNFSDISFSRPNPAPSKSPAKTGTPHAVTGTILKVTIVAESWDDPNTTEELFCGNFEVTGIKMDGPPSTVAIETVSVPLNAPIRTVRTRAWEDTTLQDIANDICANGNFSLVYELKDNPVLDRVDQRQESDLKFLLDLCKDNGASVKVSMDKLIIFDEADYEAKPAIKTYKKGDSRLLSYSFTLDSTNTASSATATIKDPKSGKLTQATFTPPNPPAVATTLNVNTRVGDMRGDVMRDMAVLGSI